MTCVAGARRRRRSRALQQQASPSLCASQPGGAASAAVLQVGYAVPASGSSLPSVAGQEAALRSAFGGALCGLGNTTTSTLLEVSIPIASAATNPSAACSDLAGMFTRQAQSSLSSLGCRAVTVPAGVVSAPPAPGSVVLAPPPSPAPGGGGGGGDSGGSESGGLSTGAAVGIGVGVGGATLLALGAVVLARRRSRELRRRPSGGSNDAEDGEQPASGEPEASADASAAQEPTREAGGAGASASQDGAARSRPPAPVISTSGVQVDPTAPASGADGGELGAPTPNRVSPFTHLGLLSPMAGMVGSGRQQAGLPANSSSKAPPIQAHPSGSAAARGPVPPDVVFLTNPLGQLSDPMGMPLSPHHAAAAQQQPTPRLLAVQDAPRPDEQPPPAPLLAATVPRRLSRPGALTPEELRLASASAGGAVAGLGGVTDVERHRSFVLASAAEGGRQRQDSGSGLGGAAAAAEDPEGLHALRHSRSAVLGQSNRAAMVLGPTGKVCLGFASWKTEPSVLPACARPMTRVPACARARVCVTGVVLMGGASASAGGSGRLSGTASGVPSRLSLSGRASGSGAAPSNRVVPGDRTPPRVSLAGRAQQAAAAADASRSSLSGAARAGNDGDEGEDGGISRRTSLMGRVSQSGAAAVAALSGLIQARLSNNGGGSAGSSRPPSISGRHPAAAAAGAALPPSSASGSALASPHQPPGRSPARPQRGRTSLMGTPSPARGAGRDDESEDSSHRLFAAVVSGGASQPGSRWLQGVHGTSAPRGAWASGQQPATALQHAVGGDRPSLPVRLSSKLAAAQLDTREEEAAPAVRAAPAASGWLAGMSGATERPAGPEAAASAAPPAKPDEGSEDGAGVQRRTSAPAAAGGLMGGGPASRGAMGSR